MAWAELSAKDAKSAKNAKGPNAIARSPFLSENQSCALRAQFAFASFALFAPRIETPFSRP
jgi:hypothetical protein